MAPTLWVGALLLGMETGEALDTQYRWLLVLRAGRPFQVWRRADRRAEQQSLPECLSPNKHTPSKERISKRNARIGEGLRVKRHAIP